MRISTQKTFSFVSEIKPVLRPGENGLYAVGHSTRTLEEFLRILEAHGVTLLADVRTVPRSGRNPQFDGSALEESLRAAGIEYRHLKNLGGLRNPRPDSLNTGWKNAGFRGYADYMQTKEFEGAVEELLRLGRGHTVAFMCAEGNPFRCHRSLLADALTARGVLVYHVSSARSKRAHTLTPFARVQQGKVTYHV